MIAAMATVLLLLVIVTAISAASVHAARHDGRPRRTPLSHLDDPTFHAPSAW